MPKGFEKLKVGMSPAAALDAVFADDRWRDHVRLRIDGGIVEKKLGYAKGTASALATLAKGTEELRTAVKGTAAETFTPVPVITVENADPFKSFDINIEKDVVTSVEFLAPYSEETYDDFMKQAKAKFGSKCEPYESTTGCHTTSCEWDLCDEHLAYEVEKADCSDASSAVSVEIKQNDCEPDSSNSNSKPKL